MSTRSQPVYQICSIGQLAHAECLEFTIPKDLLNRTSDSALCTPHTPHTLEAFVVNWHGTHVAYLNNCPHTHVNLNWSPNQFFDIESHYIQCSMHGALFNPSSGVCLRGPCLGQSLTSLPTVVDNGMVCIELSKMDR